METTRTAITPVKQALVEIAGHAVLAFLLPDGRIAAAFRMICNILGVNHRGQIRSVQADSTISDLLLLVKIDIMGTPQEMNVIIAEAIPMWLANIHESKVAPEARETLMEFQRVAVDALRAFFFPETKAQHSAPPKEEPKHSAPPKQEPAAPPPLEEDEMAYMDNLAAGHIGQELHLRALVAFQKRTEAQMIRVQQYFEEDAAGLNRHEERLNALAAQVKQQGEQMSTLSALVNRLMASDLLTADHQGEMRARIQAVAHQAGQSASAIEHELAAAFGVETIGQLPEARWGEIAAWFHQRLGW
ncbi:MAG TPA: phage antirepressor N-terminal domain-containing protein [Ktedonobacterales bacterium]|jgi:hypothetical protein